MAFSWLGSRRNKKTSVRTNTGKDLAKKHAFKPQMERLEDRLTPTAGISVLQFHIAPPAPQPVLGFGGTEITTSEPTTGTSQVTITVDRITDPGDSVALNTDVSAQFATEDETAIFGTNYTQATGTITILAGQTSATFTVDILHVGAQADGSLPGKKVFGIGLSTPSAEATINPLGDQVAVTIKDTGGTSSQRYINDSFFELLNRPADPGALQFYAPQVAGGTALQVVLLQIEGAINANGRNEYQDNTVNNAFQEFLGRDATLAELNTNDPTLTTGSLQQIKNQLVASDEYFANAGGTNVGFVSAMYRDFLNRNPDSAGLAFYVNLTASQGRLAAAASLQGSVEAVTDLVVNFYTIYLNRRPDTQGQAFYVNQLQNSVTLQTVVNEFLGSTTEYIGGES